jgi:hypothetical protein
MPYSIKVTPAHIREQQIAQLVGKSDKREPFHAYQNRELDLPTIWVPLDLLIYRMANYRTRVAQQSFIRREKKDADLFRQGQENEAAQQAQHDILVKFAEQGRAGSVTPIVEVLEVEGQHDSILITSAGVVVNGNRRVAGMRSLYDKDSNQYRGFSHVKCMVLPPTVTESEIVEVEIRLQMKQRTELDYDWINECIAIKELRDSGKTVKDLMGLMNKKKVEIDDALNALIEADLYLTDWLAAPGDYDAIEDAEQLFYDIGGSITAKSGESQELSRRIAWTLVDRRRKLKRRVYDFNPMFGKKADEVAAKLAEKLGVEFEQAGGADGAAKDDIDIDLGADAGPSFRPLIALFDDPARREDIGNNLVEICEDIIDLEKGEQDALIALKTVQKVNSLLASIDLTRAAPDSLPSIVKQLESIQAHVTRLKAALALKTPNKTDPTA